MKKRFWGALAALPVALALFSSPASAAAQTFHCAGGFGSSVWLDAICDANEIDTFWYQVTGVSSGTLTVGGTDYAVTGLSSYKPASNAFAPNSFVWVYPDGSGTALDDTEVSLGGISFATAFGAINFSSSGPLDAKQVKLEDGSSYSGGVFFMDPITGSVPEPATWAMLIAGFALAGGALRRPQTRIAFA